MIPLTTDAVNLLMPLNLSDFMRAFVSTLQPTRFAKNHFVYFGLSYRRSQRIFSLKNFGFHFPRYLRSKLKVMLVNSAVSPAILVKLIFGNPVAGEKLLKVHAHAWMATIYLF